MTTLTRYLALAALSCAFSASTQAGDDRVFELRTYTTHEGKLPDLRQRFEHHTRRLFEKHGMQNIAYWVPTDKPLSDNTLIYILVHPSREAARENWAAFSGDPEWQSVYKRSRENGPVVRHIESVFMKAEDYSRLQ